MPNESTLEVNLTHEQLSDLTRTEGTVVALSPTRYEEGNSTDPTAPFGKGYDITFSHVREIVFQHKAPTKTVVRGKDNQNKRQWLQYDLNLIQIICLAIQYNPRQAFLAFPSIVAQNQLNEVLNRTVFVDVWDIFARLQQGLATDYILVEYLPAKLPCFRPLFAKNSILDKKEYYQSRPVIRGKYASSNWAMHYKQPDPYYDIAYGDAQLCAAQPWKTILNAYQNDTYGLPIRRITRTDGGESPSDSWFDIDIAEEYTPNYRAHLTRKFALHQYTRDSDDVSVSQIEEWLLKDLNHRYRRAIQEEVLLPPEDDHELPNDIRKHERLVIDCLRTLRSTNDPAQDPLIRTKRYIHQAGKELDINLAI